MYDYIICASFGNDSIALIQWVNQNINNKKIAVIYNNTGWHSEDWEKRIVEGKKWVESLGFDFIETKYKNELGEGMESLIRKYNKFPNPAKKWCTNNLKTKPTLKWLECVDPKREAVLMTGVRREESERRSTHAEWVEEDKRYKGRSMWCPLVRHLEEDVKELLKLTPFEHLPHRSKECCPCIHANKGDRDVEHISEAKLKVIFQMEEDLTKINETKCTFFHPSRAMGAEGIYEWIDWAHAPHGKYNRDQFNFFTNNRCLSGECGR